MPIDHYSARRNITSRITKILSDYGLENAVSGGKYEPLRQKVSTTTGYWEGRSVPSKPSRLLVHLSMVDNVVTATMPRDNDNGNFAYANTAKRPVGGLSIRVLPVIKLDDEEFRPYPEWEWLLWYCFWPKLNHGSSGQVFDGFDPANGTFTYMGHVQPYIAAGLVTLNDPEDMFVDQPHRLQISYQEATTSITQSIRVAPALPMSSQRRGLQGQSNA